MPIQFAVYNFSSTDLSNFHTLACQTLQTFASKTIEEQKEQVKTAKNRNEYEKYLFDVPLDMASPTEIRSHPICPRHYAKNRVFCERNPKSKLQFGKATCSRPNPPIHETAAPTPTQTPN